MTRILVVEDEPALQRSLGRILSPLGEIDFASQGQEGIALFEVGKYDLVITDNDMPIMGGLEFLERLQQSYNPSDLCPRLMQSGGCAKPSELLGFVQAAGAAGLYLKPYRSIVEFRTIGQELVTTKTSPTLDTYIQEGIAKNWDF